MVVNKINYKLEYWNKAMALINGKQFSKLTRRYRYDDAVQHQIREFIITTMITDEDVIFNHCIVTVTDRSRRLFTRSSQPRYFQVAFYVMYYQIGNEFIGEPVLEITYDAAWELTKEEFKMRKETLPEEGVLREANEIIKPS
jgi:hypothetical protein